MACVSKCVLESIKFVNVGVRVFQKLDFDSELKAEIQPLGEERYPKQVSDYFLSDLYSKNTAFKI